jgi:hypothetical protein
MTSQDRNEMNRSAAWPQLCCPPSVFAFVLKTCHKPLTRVVVGARQLQSGGRDDLRFNKDVRE